MPVANALTRTVDASVNASVDASVNASVDALTGSVDASEGLLLDEAREAVARGDLLEDLHHL